MSVLAIDPGGTVGWALTDLDALQRGFNPDDIIAGQLGAEDFMDWAHSAIHKDCFILMERFTITSNTAKLSPGGTHLTLDVIGTIKSLCRWTGARFEFQTPKEAKGFVTDTQLKALGLWKPGEDHARDALRHLIRGLVYYTHGKACEDLRDLMSR